ncbi:hypothetical protein Lfu02_30620 [Longispora fulva]|nr:hypothetical protein Lfu02_30620 [Longispora fulva]
MEIGRAGSLGTRAVMFRSAGGSALISMTEPHSLHSGQRPTQRGGRCPQASHCTTARGAFVAERELLGVVTQ